MEMSYSYDFQNQVRDLGDELSTVIAQSCNILRLFQNRPEATQRKHEWLEDQIIGSRCTITGAVSGGACPMSAEDIAKLRLGTLVHIEGDAAVYRVTNLNTGENKATLTRVAANGSSKSEPVSGDVLVVISTPEKEGTTEGESKTHQSGTASNYTQIFRKDIIITGSAIAIDVYGGIDNQINRQTAFALGELARDLNRVALFGRRVEAAENVRGEAGGLYFFATREGSMQINANSKKFDSIMVNDAAQAILSAGGDPVQILCSPGQARVLSNEYRDQLQIVRSDDRRGAYVAVIVNEINGNAGFRTLSQLGRPNPIPAELFAYIRDSLLR